MAFAPGTLLAAHPAVCELRTASLA